MTQDLIELIAERQKSIHNHMSMMPTTEERLAHNLTWQFWEAVRLDDHGFPELAHTYEKIALSNLEKYNDLSTSITEG